MPNRMSRPFYLDQYVSIAGKSFLPPKMDASHSVPLALPARTSQASLLNQRVLVEALCGEKCNNTEN